MNRSFQKEVDKIKGLSKEKVIVMINALYKNDTDVILLSDITRNFETYGDEYYIDHGISKWELAVKNLNWKEK